MSNDLACGGTGAPALHRPSTNHAPAGAPPATPAGAAPAHAPADVRLSYKFQRLRERLRQAVASGELSGKLPGERELAKRFKANPKTLSKALTDLAAEGVLDRSIGRGTYVRGTAPPAEELAGRWLLVVPAPSCPGAPAALAVAAELRRRRPDAGADVLEVGSPLRPSFLAQFGAVIDLSGQLPEAVRKALLVRGVSVVVVGYEPCGLKNNAVVQDVPHAAVSLGRGLLLSGHRRLVLVDVRPEPGELAAALRLAAARYAPAATIEQAPTPEAGVAAATASGATAIVCGSVDLARRVRAALDASHAAAGVSVAALGVTGAADDVQPPCTGIYVDAAEVADAALDLLRKASSQRPTILYLTGRHVERGTVRILVASASPQPPADTLNADFPPAPPAMLSA